VRIDGRHSRVVAAPAHHLIRDDVAMCIRENGGERARLADDDRAWTRRHRDVDDYSLLDTELDRQRFSVDERDVVAGRHILGRAVRQNLNVRRPDDGAEQRRHDPVRGADGERELIGVPVHDVQRARRIDTHGFGARTCGRRERGDHRLLASRPVPLTDVDAWRHRGVERPGDRGAFDHWRKPEEMRVPGMRPIDNRERRRTWRQQRSARLATRNGDQDDAKNAQPRDGAAPCSSDIVHLSVLNCASLR